MKRTTTTHPCRLDPERLFFAPLAIAFAITPLTLYGSYKWLICIGDALVRCGAVAEEAIVPYAGAALLSLFIVSTIMHSRFIARLLKLPFERLIERVRDCRAFEGRPMCFRKIFAVLVAYFFPLLAGVILNELIF